MQGGRRAKWVEMQSSNRPIRKGGWRETLIPFLMTEIPLVRVQAFRYPKEAKASAARRCQHLPGSPSRAWCRPELYSSAWVWLELSRMTCPTPPHRAWPRPLDRPLDRLWPWRFSLSLKRDWIFSLLRVARVFTFPAPKSIYLLYSPSIFS